MEAHPHGGEEHQQAYNYSALPVELLQVVGSTLSSEQLRNARLVCTCWATALAHCMPAVTVALPRQASNRIFRQPLVLCSSGVLNSAQSQDYSAVPQQARRGPHHHHHHEQLLGRRRSCCRNSQDGANNSCSCKRPCTSHSCHSGGGCGAGSSSQGAGVFAPPPPPPLQPEEQEEAQPVFRDKPSPFATELGQAVLDCLLEDPLLTAATRGGGCSAGGAGAAAAHAAASGGTSSGSSSIPTLPRTNVIKAAISMPPTLAEQAVASQQQQAMQVAEHQMRKLSSVPASSAYPLPRTTRRVSRPGAATAAADVSHQLLQQEAGGALPHHAVVTTVGPVLQGWSSLPTAGLHTCSSLKQLNLKLGGAPPSPADLLDLSRLMHLTHLSFKQVDLPEGGDDGDDDAAEQGGGDAQNYLCPSPVEEDSMEGDSSSRSTSRSSSCTDTISTSAAMAVDVAGTGAFTPASGSGSCSKSPEPAGGLKRSHSIGPARLQSSLGLCSDMASPAALAATASALEHCHLNSGSAAAPQLLRSARSAGGSSRSPSPFHSMQTGPDDDDTAAAEARDQSCGLLSPGNDGAVPTRSISCSVITAEHVMALAQLPYLSSLELAPKQGAWDAAGREGLLNLVQLTGLTRLSITWGDAAAATAPLSNADAAAAAQGDQLPLQQCLAGMTSLQELCINGAAVVDAAVLQRLQHLRTLTAEGLQVVNSDVIAVINAQQAAQQQAQQEQAEQQDQQGVQAGSTPRTSQPMLSAATQQTPVVGRWASLPHLQYVHAVHPAADISLLLQSTLTPQLSHLGFVTRGPSDFARLLGQHGKLRTLHLAFSEEESWHPIAVVRLPTALPSLTSLTIDGSFWLPNSLIVALGVMDVPLEHLSLTCKLAPPCLQRLQHLKHLKRLALHHLPSGPAGPAGQQPAMPAASSRSGKAGSSSTKGASDAMLQLPAKLLPPQLQELEISNGWILH